MFQSLKRHIFRLFHPVAGEVWQLHRITEETAAEEKERPYEITPQYLENLIQKALAKGCRFVSIGQATEYITRRQTPDFRNKWIAVTLDDGYADNMEQAFPIFNKYHIPFCIYITRDYILNGHKQYRFLSVGQLQQLSREPLCTLGCHTCSHPHLASLPEEAQRKEITECKQWLEQLIVKHITHLAYPYGNYTPQTLRLARQAGFTSAVAAWGGEIRKGVTYNPYTIPRILITPQQPASA